MTEKIVFTGGGTIGHVAVNAALIPYFQQQGFETVYIGSKKGVEKEMIDTLKDVPYFAISSGKLRRYFSLQNFIDPFKVLKGIFDAYRILKKEKPKLIFSKGGFVSVPVCIAAKRLNIPVLLHESDVTPGLANKLSIRYAKHIYTTFEQTLNYLPNVPKANKSCVGAILREKLFEGNKEKGYAFTQFTVEKPVLLIMGGSLGSKQLNQIVRDNLSTLLKTYQIVHLTGKNLLDTSYQQVGYQQYEFLTDELYDVLAITDKVISRAGSNAIFEFLALKKPMLLIPLGLTQSRGDQIMNAKAFEKQGFALVLNEENLTNETFLKSFAALEKNVSTIKLAMENYKTQFTIAQFYELITTHIK